MMLVEEERTTTLKLSDVVEANRLLVSLGGEDQMQQIAAASIERSLELQNRIDRALAYAAEAPPNSMHAKNIARILDGSITVDDELNEVAEPRGLHGQPRRLAVASKPKPKTTSMRGKHPRPEGLKGRSTKERKEFREWLADQGITLPTYGPVPQEHVDAFDLAREELRKMRAAGRML